MDARAFRKSLPYAHCYLAKCDPPIEVIFDKGLLDGRTFEAGGHGLFWGNKGRVDFLMKHLGVSHKLPLNRGLGFVKWTEEGQPTTQYQVGKGQPYKWMSDEGYASTMEQLTSMATSTFDDMAKLMRTPLQGWLEQRNMHPEAYAYIKVLAASQTAQAEPALTPTGDFLGYMSIAGQIRMNLVSGSVATADTPGCIAIPQQFEKVVLAHGGEVWRDTPAGRQLLVRMGVLSVAQLREYRGYFWVIAAVGTALVTPPDAGSMIMLLMVVGGLYEGGIVAAQVFVKHTVKPETDSDTEAAKP